MSMTLIFNRRIGEQQILIADNEMKFRVFDRNTFEILATFLGPIYDTYVRQMVSFVIVLNVYRLLRAFLTKVSYIFKRILCSTKNHFSSSTKLFLQHTSLDLDRFSSKFLVFSTNKNICLYALPLDGNPFRSLANVGHTKGIKRFRVDAKQQRVFTIGYKSYSIASWRINFR